MTNLDYQERIETASEARGYEINAAVATEVKSIRDLKEFARAIENTKAKHHSEIPCQDPSSFIADE